MPITIDGTGSISGLSAGGLPDLSVSTADIAAGAVTQAKRSEDLTLATAQTASTTVVDFTGIPSWATRITVMLSGVSTNGTAILMLQLGDSGGVETTGYGGACSWGGSGTTVFNTAGFQFQQNVVATSTHHSLLTLAAMGSNLWAMSGVSASSTAAPSYSVGSKSLSATLDRIRITTVNGTDTFDAGTINIMYE